MLYSRYDQDYRVISSAHHSQNTDHTPEILIPLTWSPLQLLPFKSMNLKILISELFIFELYKYISSNCQYPFVNAIEMKNYRSALVAFRGRLCLSETMMGMLLQLLRLKVIGLRDCRQVRNLSQRVIKLYFISSRCT